MTALTADLCQLTSLPELQGEAMGFGSDVGEFVTVSEAENQPIYRFSG